MMEDRGSLPKRETREMQREEPSYSMARTETGEKSGDAELPSPEKSHSTGRESLPEMPMYSLSMILSWADQVEIPVICNPSNNLFDGSPLCIVPEFPRWSKMQRCPSRSGSTHERPRVFAK